MAQKFDPKNIQINAELFKDKRVQLGSAAVLLLLAGSIAFLTLGGTTSDAVEEAPVADTSGVPPGVDTSAGANPFPGAPATPAAGAAGGAAPNQVASAQNLRNSWSADPSLAPGTDPFQTSAKPAPIRPGAKAPGYRPDPFQLAFNYVAPARPYVPPAWSFTLPVRLAPYPKPEDQIRNGLSPEQILQPLPFVPRRVAGVLHDGAVSAILETGTPGPTADVRVVQPGSRVPSFVAGVDDLVVEAITPTQLTLRAPDRRSVVVRIGALPAGVADQIRGAIPGGVGTPEGVPPEGAPGGLPPGVGGEGLPPGAI